MRLRANFRVVQVFLSGKGTFPGGDDLEGAKLVLLLLVFVGDDADGDGDGDDDDDDDDDIDGMVSPAEDFGCRFRDCRSGFRVRSARSRVSGEALLRSNTIFCGAIDTDAVQAFATFIRNCTMALTPSSALQTDHV